ncbi:MAG TPA: hypothetical protein VNF04_17310 [Stellaceae bacterium]|nr:hypothetical protein [Stellaceae bacterium]
MADQTLSDTDFLRDVQAFVAEKWKHNPCDRCGSVSWAILQGDATILRLRAETPPSADRSFSRDNVVFIPVYCDNCGNTVNILFGVFDEWRKARRRTM